MARIIAVSGVKAIIGNIRRNERKLAAGAERGVKLAGLRLLRESQMRVPVDSGNLKASGFMRSKGTGFRTEANIGYTANYAIFVHENVEMKLKGQPRPGGRGRYWDPQGKGQAKFLEEPARTLAPVLRKIIRDSARVARD